MKHRLTRFMLNVRIVPAEVDKKHIPFIRAFFAVVVTQVIFKASSMECYTFSLLRSASRYFAI